MAFFDTTAPTDLALLPLALRDHGELADVAAIAEAEVLAAYTIRPAAGDGFPPVSGVGVAPDGAYVHTDGRAVCLYGYDPTPASADAALVVALRQEIAAYIRWRLAQHRKEPLVASSGAKDKAVAYRDDAEERTPPGFGRWLIPFDVRPKLYTI